MLTAIMLILACIPANAEGAVYSMPYPSHSRTTLSRYASCMSTFKLDPPHYIKDDYTPAKGSGRVIIFLYHHVVDEMGPMDDPDSVTTTEKFKYDMESLLEKGLVPLSLEQWYNGDYRPDRDYFILTFDDGYLSNYEIVYPLLSEYGITADIFMCTGLSGLPNHFSYYQADEMVQSGWVDIYSHTINHTKASDTDHDSFLLEESRSYESIQIRLDENALRLFSYPNSSYDRYLVEALYEAGVKAQFVQFIHSKDLAWLKDEYRLTKRMNIRYDSDVCEEVDRFFEEFYPNKQ